MNAQINTGLVQVHEKPSVPASVGAAAEILLSRNLLYWREHRGISSKQAAERLGVAKSTWSQWEKGTRLPSLPNLMCIALMLEIAVGTLLASESKVTVDDTESGEYK